MNEICKKSTPAAFPTRDKRERKPNPRKTRHKDLNYVGDHLNSIPKYVSHYSRKDQKSRRYIHNDLTVRKLYEIYVEKSNAANRQPVSFSAFSAIERHEFNMSRHPPLKDTCNQCDVWKTKVDAARKSNNLHLKRELFSMRYTYTEQK